ncbi:MAG TPA: dethiobiotin synthase [Verrucomicrobiae bacterium]|nr:dethiobiotin synthase [Verrucomicrobiae bacterium]
MHRYFVTGTDTDVGKTRVAAALALALRLAGHAPTVVKLVQTGLPHGEPGDAARAGALAGTPFLEAVRFAAAADPWSAALAEHRPPVRALELADFVRSRRGPLVAEGSGGIMVPLGPGEHLGHAVALACLPTIVAVGLRLGCLNHALLTAELCERLGIPLAGAVLVERWGAVEPAYRDDVARALQGKLRILGMMPFAADEAHAVANGARMLEPLLAGRIEECQVP